MIDAVLGLFGPLAKPECVRASRRGWLIWLRMLPAVGTGLVVCLVLWLWSTILAFDPSHLPYYEIRIGVLAIVGSLVALALLIPPSLLAGTLAGEKERGSIALLLSTQANASDIVLSRWVGRLAPLGLVAGSAFPALLGLAILAGMEPPVVLTLVGLPVAIALGTGGFALGVSAVSKRGRDALLLVFLVEIVLALGSGFAASFPAVSTGAWWSDWLESIGLGMFQPFGALNPLVWNENTAPAVMSAVSWLLLGLVGLGVAAWRLRPSCLNDGSGASRSLGRFRRRWSHQVPPVSDRPMLWKEFYIERGGSLGRVGRWIGALIVLWLALGSLILGGLVARGDDTWPVATLASWYGRSALLISLLIQWSIGLRAGVTIASERERGTWDALLTSPLEGREIVRSKLWGSLHALRWLIGAALLAWTITWLCDGMGNLQYSSTLAETLCWSILMSAGGVAMSLRSATATKAMGATLAGWLVAYLALKVLAVFVCSALAAACALGWLVGVQMGFVDFNSRVWFPTRFSVGMVWAFCGETLILAFILIAEIRVRFDRTAGRMTGGATAVKIDELIHGRPMAPVQLGSPKHHVNRSAPLEPVPAAELLP